MMTVRVRAALAAAAAAVVLVLSGCSTDTAETSSGTEQSVRQVDPATAVELIAADAHTVIDVRTPAEFDGGHVAGAQNIDVQAPDFADAVGALDREGSYLVYCRSGNRSAAAADIMADLGFTDVVDAGGLDALLTAGAPLG